METSRTKICPFCAKAIPAIASSCRLCGGEFVRPTSAMPAHIATVSATCKKKARRLFWLGLVITFIGCFYSASSDMQFAGNAIDASVYALGTATLNYLTGVLPAVVNSFQPPFLSPSGGLASRALVFAGAATLVWASRSFVRGKGHSEAWGFLGVLGIAGLLILIALPDKYKSNPALRHRRSY